MDIHNYRRRLDNAMERIKNLDIPAYNKKALADFVDHSLGRSLSLARIEHYVQIMKYVCEVYKKPFNQMTKDDMIELVRDVQLNEWSDRYKHDFLIAVRVFFKWMRQTEDYPEEVKWIRPSYKDKHKLPEDILTEEEVKLLAEKADNLRDKAFVLVLYETGCRIGEVLTMKIRNVQSVEHGMTLRVDGKTGTRRVLIISSAPALGSWLNLHPYRNNPDSLVWLGIGNRNKNDSLKYPAVLMLLKRLGKSAGIKKRVNPHSFRHARATHLANKLTEAQMKQYFGWTQDSDMAGTYVHLSGRDVDNALLKMHGIANDEDRREEVMKLRICSRCKENNDPVSDFCKRCGSALGLKTVLDMEEKREIYDNFMFSLLKILAERDSTIKKEFNRLAKEKGFQDMFRI